DEYNWAIEGTIRPPVTYGVRPDGSKTLTAAKPAHPKRAYRVEVFGAGAYGVHTKGSREFRVP
ncbi:MAG TPA: hypothetical protein VMO47_02355, partial [Rhodothermales bacterium]|nr:hypothetical protein [Rhodothermales bacterium]